MLTRVACLHTDNLPAAASAVIGGADGPTSVFVTVRVFPVGPALLALLLVLGVVGPVLTARK